MSPVRFRQRVALCLSTVGLALALLVGCSSSEDSPSGETAGAAGTSGWNGSGSGGKSGGGSAPLGGGSSEAGADDTSSGGEAGSSDTSEGGAPGSSGNTSVGGSPSGGTESGGSTSLGGGAGTGGSTSVGGAVESGGTTSFGGAAGTGNAGPTGTVYSTGFEAGGQTGGWAVGGWQIDTLLGAHDGQVAVHPPTMLAGDTPTMTVNCNNAVHTQLAFWAYNSNGTSNFDLTMGTKTLAAGVVIPYNGVWKQYVFDVPQGAHTYTFTAHSATNTAPPFVLDSFVCKNITPVAGPGGQVSFDQGFIPIESGGTWLVDNLNGAQAGEAAIHPPAMLAGDTPTMTFNCNSAVHTQLSFWAYNSNGTSNFDLTMGAQTLAAGVVIPYNGVWKQYVFDVPQGAHTYTFTAHSATNTAPPFALDSFVCKNITPVAGPGGQVSFDQGFIPIESGGTWLVDNLNGAQAGEAAIHPPAMLSSETPAMTFNCNSAVHTQLSFWAYNSNGTSNFDLTMGAQTLAAGVVIPYNGVWKQYVFDVPQGAHTYTFTAHSATNTAPPFVLDSFVCKNIIPVAGPGGQVSFDQGFIPIESGGTWLVDNLNGAQAGEAAIHPPAMLSSETPAMTFNCNSAVHTQLSFWAYNSNGTSNFDLTLGTQSLAAGVVIPYNGVWKQYVFDVPQGAHTYTFTAHSSTNTAPPFVLDSFACKNITPVAGPGGQVSFDQGFIPIESGGTWLVDNLNGAQAGEAAIHPPAMLASETPTMTFNCNSAVHTQLSFWAYNSNGTSNFDLTLGTQSLAAGVVIPYNGVWKQYVFDVPQGAHTYTFTAHSSTNTAPPFVLDSFVCKNLAPVAGSGGQVSFDQGFIPVEVGGTWLVDNLNGAQAGEAAIHPPAMLASETPTMTFNCNSAVHTQLSFWAYNSNGTSTFDLTTGAQSLASATTIPYNGVWKQYTFTVAQGVHTYTFTAHSSTDTKPPFVLDSFVCQ